MSAESSVNGDTKTTVPDNVSTGTSGIGSGSGSGSGGVSGSISLSKKPLAGGKAGKTQTIDTEALAKAFAVVPPAADASWFGLAYVNANFTVRSSGVGLATSHSASAYSPNEVCYVLVWIEKQWVLCKWVGRDTTTMQRTRVSTHSSAVKKALSVHIPKIDHEFTSSHLPHISDAVFVGVTKGVPPPAPAEEKKASAVPSAPTGDEPVSPGGSLLSAGSARHRALLSQSNAGIARARAASGLAPLKTLKEDSKATLPAALPPLTNTLLQPLNGSSLLPLSVNTSDAATTAPAPAPTTPNSAAAAAAASGSPSPSGAGTGTGTAPPPRPSSILSPNNQRRHSHHQSTTAGHGPVPSPLIKFKGHSGLLLHDEEKLSNVVKLMAAPFSPVNYALLTYKSPTTIELKATGVDGTAGFESALKADAIVYLIFVSTPLGTMPKRIWFVYWIGSAVKMVTKGASHGHRIDLNSFFKVLVPLSGVYEIPSAPHANFVLKTLPAVLTAQLADAPSDEQKHHRRLRYCDFPRICQARWYSPVCDVLSSPVLVAVRCLRSRLRLKPHRANRSLHRPAASLLRVRLPHPAL